MRNIFRPARCGELLFVLLCLLTTTNPLDAQWIQTDGPYVNSTYLGVRSLAVSGANLFAGTYINGVFLTQNSGTNWTSVNSGLTILYITSFAVLGTNLFAGTYYGVFLTTDNGTTWSEANSPYSYFLSFAVVGTNLFAGTDGAGVFLSFDNGRNWTKVNTGLINPYVFSLAPGLSGNLFAGTNDGVYLSTDNGTSWTAVNTDMRYTQVNTLAASGTNLFAGTHGQGVFLSTNNGTSWNAVNTGLTYPYIGSLAVSDTKLFAGTLGGGVFLSTDNGTIWTAVNTGLTFLDIPTLAISGSNLFAGTTDGGVWRRPLSEMTTAELSLNNTVLHFELAQNYPNPFNPTTTISFSLPSKSFVSLKVFDALGREVSIILSEQLPAGIYSRQWNAERFPSGMYFYRLQSGIFSETKKLLLLR